MKTWKKLVWSKSRAFIALRISDLNFAKIQIGKSYEYSIVIPKDGQMIINFRKCKK